MVTLKLKGTDIEHMSEYLYGPNGTVDGVRPENFIFNEYIIELEDNKDIGYYVVVNRAESMITVYCNDLNVMGNSVTKKKVIFTKAKCHIDKSGEINKLVIDDLSGKMIDVLSKDKSLTDDEIIHKAYDFVLREWTIASIIEHYVMTKLREQKTDIEYVKRDIKKIVGGQRQTSKKQKSKKPITINLNDIERSINVNKGTKPYERHIDSWEVRGHYRHYKSGKVTFIKAFTKGNKDVKPQDRDYTIK